MTQPVAFALNGRIHNKPPEWRQEFASEWQTTEGTLQSLRDAVSSGQAFVPAAMSSSHRTSAAFLHSDIAVVDVDNGLTIAKFLEHPLARQAAWVYTTASHNPALQAERFRIIFRLPRRITDPALYKAAVTVLSRSLGGDKSCTDPCRLFYGNSAAEHPLWTPDAALDDGFMQQVRNEAARQRQSFDHSLAEIDDNTLQRAAFVLEQIIQPTQDGERDRFIRITAAARSAGDHLFEPWVRWASTTHHGTGKNARQASERFFRGMKGSSVGTLFYLASEDDPDWRDKVPAELKVDDYKPQGIYGPAFAGYGHEDFLEDFEDHPPIESTNTQSLFSADGALATASAPTPTPPQSQRPTGMNEEAYASMVQQFEEAYQMAEESDEPFDYSDIPLSEPPAWHNELDDEPAPAAPRRGRPRTNNRENEARRVMELLAQSYPGLRLNLASQNLEYGPKERPEIILDSSTIYVTLSAAADKTYAKTLVHDAAYVLGHQNRYNPVKTYLETCAATVPPSPHFKTIASDFIGVPDDGALCPTMPDGRKVADVVMERFMIAAVARAMHPGCICDWMPILVGKQHTGKTTFLQYMTPPDPVINTRFPYFNTVQQGVGYIKDRPHILHCGWIVCFDEVERLFKRQYTEELKNLISVAIDRSAPKYQNERDFPRSFVLCGATNSFSFLQDPTGNRRFLPIIVLGKVPSPRDPKVKRIDLDSFKKERDALWSAAVAAFRQGETYLFDSYELSSIDSYMDSFFEDTPLEFQVDRILETHYSGIHNGQNYIVLADLFKWLDISIPQQTQLTRQVTDILKRRGWAVRRVSIRRKVHRIWIKPDRPIDRLMSLS